MDAYLRKMLAYLARNDELFVAGFNSILKNQSIILRELDKMSAQTDALTAEVEQVMAVVVAAVPAIEAMREVEEKFQAHLSGDEVDTDAVVAATSKLAAARESLSEELAKLSPAASGQQDTNASQAAQP